MNRNIVLAGLFSLISVALAMAGGAIFSGTARDTAGGSMARQPAAAPMARPAPAPGAPPMAAAGGQPTAEQIVARVEALRQRLEQDPENVEGWKMLGRSMLVLGRPADAVGAFARAAQLAPSDPEIRAALSQLEGMARGSGRHPAPGESAGDK